MGDREALFAAAPPVATSSVAAQPHPTPACALAYVTAPAVLALNSPAAEHSRLLTLHVKSQLAAGLYANHVKGLAGAGVEETVAVRDASTVAVTVADGEREGVAVGVGVRGTQGHRRVMAAKLAAHVAAPDVE